MKIIFLGTGHGVPAADRSCFSAMIRVGDKSYYIDAGAAVAERSMQAGFDPSEAVAVFTTHAHGDHLAGLYQFIDLFNWRYRESELDVYLTEERISSAMTELVSATARELDRDRIRIHTVTPDFIYDDGTARVSLFKTAHIKALGRPSYGIIFEAEGKRICFSGDLSQKLLERDFPVAAYDEGTDLLVLEMAHFGIGELREYLPRIKAKSVAFAHVYPLNKYSDIATLDGTYSFKTLTPSDMDSIEI